MKITESGALGYAAIAAATSGVLTLDLLTPLGYAVGVGYLLPLVLVFGLRDKRYILAFTLCCSVLIAAAFFLKPQGAHPSIALFNRFLSLSILWITFLLLYYRRRAQERLQKSQDALKESEAKFRSLAEEALIGIYLIQGMRFSYVNPRFAEMLGYSAAEILSMKGLNELATPERAFSEEIIRLAFSGESQSTSYQVQLLKKDGTPIEVEGICTRTYINGRPALIGTAIDITERKVMERQKADFYAMVTHDLKSPLTSIMGYAELIASNETAHEDAGEMAQYIIKNSQKLNRLVEDFLMHSRIKSGTAAMNCARTDISGLLTEVLDGFEDQAAKCGLTLTVAADDTLPPLFVDKAQIARALSNLVQNAINYTPEGGSVTLKANRRTGKGSELVVLSVADTGPGISADEQAKVFDKYYRSAKTAGIKGTGLGLAIVKAVAEAHGGRVELNSEPGKGSIFSLVLPVSSVRCNRTAA